METEVVRRCPKCGYEYESWVEICPDCGVAVETVERKAAAPGLLDPNEDPHWTIVMNAPNAIIGNFLMSQLKDAGIPVLMQRAQSADIAQFTGFDFVPQVLRVPQDRVDDAREVLDSRSDVSSSGYLWNTGLEQSETVEAGDGVEVETDDPGGAWRLLPTEDDVRARQQVRRWHGAVDDAGWEYEDEDPMVAPVAGNAPDEVRRRVSRRDEDAYYDYVEDYSGDDWYKGKWARIVYGILIAALTIPFIFQLLGQLGNILGGFGGGR
jgi:hypothetical protein